MLRLAFCLYLVFGYYLFFRLYYYVRFLLGQTQKRVMLSLLIVRAWYSVHLYSRVEQYDGKIFYRLSPHCPPPD